MGQAVVFAFSDLAHAAAGPPGAGKKSHAEMHKVLDKLRTDLAAKIAVMRAAVMTVEGQTLKADVASQGMTSNHLVEVVDYAVIEDAYKRAGGSSAPIWRQPMASIWLPRIKMPRAKRMP